MLWIDNGMGRELIEEGALVPGKARRIQSLELVR